MKHIYGIIWHAMSALAHVLAVRCSSLQLRMMARASHAALRWVRARVRARARDRVKGRGRGRARDRDRGRGRARVRAGARVVGEGVLASSLCSTAPCWRRVMISRARSLRSPWVGGGVRRSPSQLSSAKR